MSIPQRIFFDFQQAIQRIILFFYAWIKWTVTLINNDQSSSSLQNIELILSPKDKYIELCKKKFLASFEKTDVNWNSNIEPIFADTNALAELMKDPQNELERNWRTRILIENTPRGNVIMFYDAYKRGLLRSSSDAV